MTGRDLYDLRKSLGLSQERMAQQLFISRRKYQYAEGATGDIGAVMTLIVNGLKYALEREQAA